jgi:EmrB/QacA subfamily drug resistance transporter
VSAISPQTGDGPAGLAVGDAARPAPPRRLGLALAVIATAQLMVVLDATIVNVALPHIQDALHFSGTNLEWVVNAYALAFGGLLLLGGRSGDLLGRRRIFIFGILLFSAASLLGGLATSQAWLLSTRALQGVGGAFAAPAALSLIAVTFPEGKERNRAMGVYAAMSVAGSAVGLLIGGVLTSYATWRWVFFVNVPIGLLVAFLAPRVLGESGRRPGKFDLPGAVTGSLGIASLVYGLSNAATTSDGVSHWGDAKVIASLAAAAVLLVTFGFVEARSGHPLVPVQLLRSRDRTGSYLISLCTGTALFGMFFFMTVFVQSVWGYSPVKTGLAFLPMVCTILVGSAVSAQLVARAGARPLMIAGAVIVSGGILWMSRLTEHSSYAGGMLGPLMLTGTGIGLIFVPLQLVALAKVPDGDAGAASSLLNTGQQVGGSIGLALLGSLRSAHLPRTATKAARTAASNHALAHGFSRGYLTAAAIVLLALVIALVVIRVKRADLAGVDPMAAPN